MTENDNFTNEEALNAVSQELTSGRHLRMTRAERRRAFSLPPGTKTAEVPPFDAAEEELPLDFEAEESEPPRKVKKKKNKKKQKKTRRARRNGPLAKLIGPKGMYPLLSMGAKLDRQTRRGMLVRRILLLPALLLIAVCVYAVVFLSTRSGAMDPRGTQVAPTPDTSVLTVENVPTASETPEVVSVTATPSPAPTATPAPTEEPVRLGSSAGDLLGLSGSSVSADEIVGVYDGKPIFPIGQDNGTLKLGRSALQNAVANADRALNRPLAHADGWLPIFTSANTTEKIVAITVDDCFQTQNLIEICKMTLAVNGKLTIFPIGECAVREELKPVLRKAHEVGFELENHTYTHNGLFNCTNDELALEIWRMNQAISDALGVTYQCHFLRPKGGDARADQRMHTYADQMGYYGIAHWSVSGSDLPIDEIEKQLAPGAVYLFHTTQDDLNKLREFIPYLTRQGYRMVTMNEMFGYPENETTVSIGAGPVPLRDYQVVRVECRKGSYSHLVRCLQDRLYELGYLTKPGDGVYGNDTVAAVSTFQMKAGLPADGIADKETQLALLAAEAPVADIPQEDTQSEPEVDSTANEEGEMPVA